MTSYFAPGRVNLIGEHTDYGGGLALPVAIDRGITLEGARRAEGLKLESEGHGSIDLPLDAASTSGWGRYPLAVVAELRRAGCLAAGIEGRIRSELPPGAGLSSSAALEVVIALSLLDVGTGECPLDRDAIVRICRDAEERAVGVPCGLLDQAAIVLGRRDHALFISFEDFTHRHVPWPGDIAILVLHSGVPRRLEQSAYAARRQELRAGLAGAAGPVARRRARHFSSENERVREMVRLLLEPSPDPRAIGDLLLLSHASLQDDFEVSTPQLDRLVMLAKEHGAYGARLTGAGFGGAVVALAPAPAAEELGEEVLRGYGEWAPGLRTSCIQVTASDGARRLGNGVVRRT
jgi:galactokinase